MISSEIGQRREHAAAADHDAGVRFFLDAGGQERVGLLAPR